MVATVLKDLSDFEFSNLLHSFASHVHFRWATPAGVYYMLLSIIFDHYYDKLRLSTYVTYLHSTSTL